MKPLSPFIRTIGVIITLVYPRLIHLSQVFTGSRAIQQRHFETPLKPEQGLGNCLPSEASHILSSNVLKIQGQDVQA